MTDRVQSLTIILDEDYRVDDVEAIKQAIQMVRGVRSAENGPVVGHEDWMARSRMAVTYEKAIWKTIERLRNGEKE